MLTTQYDHVTAEMLKRSYLGKPVNPADEKQEEENKSFMQAIDFEIGRFKEKVEKGLRAKRTLQKWKATKDKLSAFIRYKFKKADVPLEIIKPGIAEDMLHYFTVVDNLDHNSAMKYIKNTKQVLTTAAGRWITNNPLRDFRCTYIQPEREVLTMEEIMMMHQQPLIERLDKVRDIFLFSCFTGLAYQEVYNLTAKDIVKGNDGNKWVKINRLKTGCPEEVPLLPVPAAIIAKYQQNEYCRAFGQLLPVISNTKYNAYLKEVVQLCNIDKIISTHSARHTFATTVTLENDVPIETVSKMLGHKSIRTTQIYARITKKKISNDMNALSKKLFAEGNFETNKPPNRLKAI